MSEMSAHDGQHELILLPALTAHRTSSGALVLTRKYLQGADEYAKHWPGPVTSLVMLRDQPTTDMDHVAYKEQDWKSRVETRPPDLGVLAERVKHAALVFPFLSPFEWSSARLCHRLGVPVVFGSEYTPRTERQIIDAQVRNPLRRLRRKLWVVQAERKRLWMLRWASGLQCSGTPCFDHYRAFSRHPVLFFDNRVPVQAVISLAELEQKSAVTQPQNPLKLVFGGRLIGMKGVMDLPLVARELASLGIPFEMDIYGKGDLEQPLLRRIESLQLADNVRLRGTRDFQSEWIPILKQHADLFVCCHPQGDPSSTYPEVMSCGVPIVGYANEAFSGIIRESGAGWATPMSKPRALAKKIAELAADRAALASAARRGREFALEHAFEQTFSARVRHLVQCSRLPDVNRV